MEANYIHSLPKKKTERHKQKSTSKVNPISIERRTETMNTQNYIKKNPAYLGAVRECRQIKSKLRTIRIRKEKMKRTYKCYLQQKNGEIMKVKLTQYRKISKQHMKFKISSLMSIIRIRRQHYALYKIFIIAQFFLNYLIIA